MYDSDYCGVAKEGPNPIRCRCNAVAVKNVAFEGCWTDKRFLSCPGEDGESCGFVHWVDDVWPDSLCKSLLKLWDMYSEAKDGRVRDALNRVEAKFEFEGEIRKLQTDLKKAQDELKVVVEEKQVTLALKAKEEQAMIEANDELEEKKKLDASSSNMHRCMRLKAEKDKEKLKDEKRKLEHMIADLLSQKEKAKAKIRKIKDFCDEVYL
uniref:Uncharacterized protein n=1 Tax=Avena sativa TaxID=4498 RepID=A0ACD5UQ46_AVESA